MINVKRVELNTKILSVVLIIETLKIIQMFILHKYYQKKFDKKIKKEIC